MYICGNAGRHYRGMGKPETKMKGTLDILASHCIPGNAETAAYCNRTAIRHKWNVVVWSQYGTEKSLDGWIPYFFVSLVG